MKLPECLTIDSVQTVANDLKLLSVDTSSPVELDFSGVTDIDLSGIQLIVAVIKEAKRRNRQVLCMGKLDPAVTARFEALGFAADTLVSGQDLLRLLDAQA